MEYLNQKIIMTEDGEKQISVHACDIRDIDETIDVMAFSAFYRSYAPTPGTLIYAMETKGIPVNSLSKSPEIDLRDLCNIWLSKSIDKADMPIKRIGCLEMSRYTRDRSAWKKQEEDILMSIQAYFRMLDIASLCGICIDTIGLPVPGGGSQGISMELVLIPMLNECIRFLKTNHAVKRIMIITYNHSQAFRFANALENSYSVQVDNRYRERSTEMPLNNKKSIFISYSSKDRNIADNLCSKLENRGMKVWYAPRNIKSDDYASSIVEAINKCTHFIVILSRSSMHSNHVLNEIDLAFREIDRGISFLPLKIDEEEMGPAFLYYLSRQHWMDACLPPLDRRLQEFTEKIEKL